MIQSGYKDPSKSSAGNCFEPPLRKESSNNWKFQWGGGYRKKTLPWQRYQNVSVTEFSISVQYTNGSKDLLKLMSRTIKRTPFKWEKGRGDKCCSGPESCLLRARPVLGACVSEWHVRPCGCHGAQRQGGVYLCQAPGGMVARGSRCAHRFSPKLRQPRHRFSVGLKGCRQQHYLSPKPFNKKNN